MQQISISSKSREQFLDITSQVQDLLRANNWLDGVLYLHCTHTTAGLTVNESADPSVPRDILKTLSSLVPEIGDYQHSEGNSDAHIKSCLMGCGLQLMVQNGRLVLGTWQGIFFTEFDGPRKRKVIAKWIAA